MRIGHGLRIASLVAVVLAGSAVEGLAQRPTGRPTATSESRPDQDLKTQAGTSDAAANGAVALPDGSPPVELIEIYAGCDGAQKLVAVADARGKFTFSADRLGPTKGHKCLWRAELAGYRSAALALPEWDEKAGVKLGTAVLQPVVKNLAILTSTTDELASKGQKKLYREALDDAAEQHWTAGVTALEKATSEYPGFGSAWLTLGILQETRGDLANAEKSFLQAIKADPHFALPLIRAASLEESQGNWNAVLEHSQKAITSDPTAFPNAYALNAMANVSLQHADTAEKSAREGLKLDAEKQFPELDFSLGVVLYTKGDMEGAQEHLKAYLRESPHGPNAAVARTQLEQTQAQLVQSQTTANAAPLPTRSDGEAVTTEGGSTTSAEALAATILSIQEQNAPLLMNTPLHTCLETIARTQVDNHGQMKAAETLRLEVGVSGGKEIYSQPNSKNFSSESLANLLGYTFSTTGLFSSIARAVIAGKDMRVEPAGQETLNGEAVLRFNFHLDSGLRDWSIQYGKETGMAGEEGWFLVESVSKTLRRVVVSAVDIPRNVKLKSLRAIIDYEPETIKDRRVLLPGEAQVSVEEIGGAQRVSKIFFDHCGTFGSESRVSFEEGEGSAGAGRLVRQPILPADLEIVVALSSPVSLARSEANDTVAGTVARPVMVGGREFIARGALIGGHVRPRRGQNAVVLEFDRVQTSSGWAPFWARLESLPPGVPAHVREPRGEGKRERGFRGDAAALDVERTGVVKIIFNSPTAELPAYSQMIWKTESLAEPTHVNAPQLNTSLDLH